MLTIQYFASIREALDRNQEQLQMPDSVSTVEQLIQHLVQLNPHFSTVFNADKKVLIAVNQVVADKEYELAGNEEVAFFPPMTGG